MRLEADRKRYPAIADEVIRHPLFVVGLPRTGSTLLHHLLAQDPGGRVARAWEVMEPSPPPDRARYVLLMLFLALLALAPAALPALLLVAAIGAHTYWVGHLALRLRHQSGRYALFDDTL